MGPPKAISIFSSIGLAFCFILASEAEMLLNSMTSVVSSQSPALEPNLLYFRRYNWYIFEVLSFGRLITL